MTEPKPPLIDTHGMTVEAALGAIAGLKGPTRAQLRRIHKHEAAHPKRPRKGILDALEERIGETLVVAAYPEPDPFEPEVATEDTPEPVAEEIAEPIVDDEPVYEPPSGEFAGMLIGQTVEMTDDMGIVHEAVVVRDTKPEERPIIATMRDGRDTEVFLRYDPDGNQKMSWRMP